MAAENHYNLTPEQVEKLFDTDVSQGLSTAKAAAAREKYGLNEFTRKKHKTIFQKFLDQFKSFMIIVLLVAAIISGVVGYINHEGYSDAIIILAIIVLNACIGVAQEAKAEKSLEALEKLSSPQCKVFRGGKMEIIESRDLVPGDVVILETGDSVPADMRLVEAINLQIQEAALTGESMPSEKNIAAIEGEAGVGDRSDMAFASTSVTYGRGKGIVTATGMATEVGKIAALIQSVRDVKTPMQKRLDKLGQILAFAALIICALIFGIGVLYGRGILDMFMIAVSLAVAAIPEGLPAVSTIVLAFGVQRMVKRHAIVRKLPSVETLGSTQIICSDKTGTLTQNRMTVVKIFHSGGEYTVEEMMVTPDEDDKQLSESAVLVNDAKMSRDDNGKWETKGDPTETALVDLAIRLGLVKEDVDKEYPRVAEIPFDSERKMMATIHKSKDSKLTVAVKGGLDEVLACCDRIYEHGELRPLTDADRKKIDEANLDMARNALRVLAIAMNQIDELPKEVNPSTIERNLVFVGLMGMIDPPREEVKVAVHRCKTAGIKPVMITGDHKITATAIATQLGIMEEGDQAVSGAELEVMDDEQLRTTVTHTSVFARVSPEHKVRIVKAFQANGKIVAMTGDGVNDAPALKLADIGVAMGITGTDVSKEAADVVLTDDNFATIVTAVEEGRRIYDNILKVIQFLLSTNFGEVLVLLVAVLLNWESPLLPIHILWINLVTDSLPGLAMCVDPANPHIMERKPIDSRQGIMNRTFATRIILQGFMIGGLSLTAYQIGLPDGIEAARTMTFGVLALSQVSMAFAIRTNTRSAFKVMFNNKILLGALVIVAAMMLVVMEVPALFGIFRVVGLNGIEWLWVAVLSLAPLVVTEIIKAFVRLLTVKK